MNVVIKETHGIPCTFPLVRAQQVGVGYEQGRGYSPECDLTGTLILDGSASRTVRNKFTLLVSNSVSGISVQQAKQTKPISILYKHKLLLGRA